MAESEIPRVRRVEPSEGYYVLENVPHKGENRTYKIYDDLTKPMNLQDLSEYSQRKKEKGNPYVPSADEFCSILHTIARSMNSELIQGIKKKLRGNWVRVLTAIDWKNSDSQIIHNPDTSYTYFVDEKNVVGNNGLISEIDSSGLVRNVCGIETVEEMNFISDKINKTPTYLYRIGLNQDKKLRTSVEFHANSDLFGLFCYWNPSDLLHAFRVLQVD